MIFIDFGVSGGREVVTIRGKLGKRGKERLGEQENDTNGVVKMPERRPEAPKGEPRGASRSHDHHWPGGSLGNFLGPGPALSILDTKIQRN